MFRSKFIIFLALSIIFLFPVVKSIPYVSVVFWFLGLGIITTAFIQTLIEQIKSSNID